MVLCHHCTCCSTCVVHPCVSLKQSPLPLSYVWGGRAQNHGTGLLFKVFHDAVMLSLTPILFIAMLIGMILPSRSLRGHVFHWWLLAIVAFALIAGNGHRHQWYLLPLTPVAAALAGRACDAIWSKVMMPMGRNIFIIAASICFIGFIYLSYLSIRPLYNPLGSSSTKSRKRNQSHYTK